MTLPSGLAGTVAELRTFAAGVSFDRPGLLWLSLLPVGLAVLGWFAERRRRADVAAVGRPAAVAGLVTRRRGRDRVARFLLSVGWASAVLGAAGPRWGDGDPEGVAVGRDVVVVLDLSRSMLAADTRDPPERWRSAVAGARDLVAALRDRGGHRVGVVGFAARPAVLVPLTTDLDHADAVLAALDGHFPPPAVRPGPDGPGSGTRIGAALAAAVAALDPRFPGSRDLVLLSDGDDPADDREWAAGVSAARAAGVPVHVVGVGDPARDSTVLVDGKLLEAAGPGGVPTPVQTRLREDVLREIAAAGRGDYLPARQDRPRLGEFFRTRIEPHPSRELADDARPRPRDRSAGFLAGAAMFLLLGWWRER